MNNELNKIVSACEKIVTKFLQEKIKEKGWKLMNIIALLNRLGVKNFEKGEENE